MNTTCTATAILRITPLGPVDTDQVVTWLVHEDAKEGIDYGIESLSWLHSATIGQDRLIVEFNQAGMSSSAYLPGPYTKLESQLPKIHNDYIRALKYGRAVRSKERFRNAVTSRRTHAGRARSYSVPERTDFPWPCP